MQLPVDKAGKCKRHKPIFESFMPLRHMSECFLKRKTPPSKIARFLPALHPAGGAGNECMR